MEHRECGPAPTFAGRRDAAQCVAADEHPPPPVMTRLGAKEWARAERKDDLALLDNTKE
jgi:hypothetical protein